MCDAAFGTPGHHSAPNISSLKVGQPEEGEAKAPGEKRCVGTGVAGICGLSPTAGQPLMTQISL